MICASKMSRMRLSRRLFSLTVRKYKKDKEVSHSNEGLQEAYELVAYMTVDDLAMQNNFDEGRQFSFPSEHYLDRKEITRKLPDEIDLMNCGSIDLDKIYDDLRKLDCDKSVQLKYFKKYLKNHDDLIVNLIQEFNGIDKKFKLLRRNEVSSLSLSPSAFYHNENLFNHTYNVVGFDKSISGLPLYSGKFKPVESCYPKEFIEDLQMFRKKIPVQKRDLNFLELEKDSVCIDPKVLLKAKSDESLGPEKLDSFMSAIYKKGVPEFTIEHKNIHDYKTLPPISMGLNEIFENEVTQLRKFLQGEIKLHSNKSCSRVLMFANQDIKSNQFKLCEISRKSLMNTASFYVVSYDMKEFNAFPNYAWVLSSRRQLKNLRNHLFKLFLINLEDQMDILIRIKYYNAKDMNSFIDHIKSIIASSVQLKLVKPIMEYTKDASPGIYCDASVYKPSKHSVFKRIYWNNYAAYNCLSPRSRKGSLPRRKPYLRIASLESYLGVRESD